MSVRRSPRLHWLLFAALVLQAPASPLHAREWASAGGWDISEAGNDGCGMGLEYEGEGETILVLILKVDGTVGLSLTNYKWSAVANREYDLIFVVNGTAYEGGKSVGTSDGYRKGFVTLFDPGFLKDFAAAKNLKVGSKGVLIDSLNLEGSAAGLAQLRRCVAHVKAVAAAEAREKARLAHIPEDPFASVKGTPPSAVTGARSASGSLSSLIGQDDYPPAAIMAGEQGSVGFRLTVGPSGRVTGCSILKSSGSQSLDIATCRILRSRARFTPAKAADGTPVESSVDDSVTWRLN